MDFLTALSEPITTKKESVLTADDFFSALSGIDGFPDLAEIIDNEIEKEGSAHSYGGMIMHGLHPSFISKATCVWAYWYSLELPHEQEDFSPQFVRIMDNGSAVHDRLQTYLGGELYGTWKCNKCGMIHNLHSGYRDFVLEHYKTTLPGKEEDYFKKIRNATHSLMWEKRPSICDNCKEHSFTYQEWRVIDKLNHITGKIDGIIKWRDEFFGLEFKSANINTFTKSRHDTPLITSYKKQLAIYLNALGIKKGIILLENKNDQSFKQFPFSADKVDLSIVYENIRAIRRVYAGEGTLEPARKRKECPECRYLGKCIPK